MEGFEEFLRKSQVREKYIPYYVRWVTKCYGFLEKKFNDRVDTFQKDRFLEHIARKHEEWQVKQADYENFTSTFSPRFRDLKRRRPHHQMIGGGCKRRPQGSFASSTGLIGRRKLIWDGLGGLGSS
ncbi:MAG: hypothetical protein DRI92_04065 [Aquificota bacterium]|nr:MAG: hypothetical protein DRI92_04065 [Aquificota bacterium]